MTASAAVHRVAPVADAPLAAVILAESKKNDGWANTLTGLGAYNRDKRMHMRFAPDVPLDAQSLDDMFSGDDVVRRICELLPREMTREWIEVSGDDEGKLMAKMDALGIRCAFKEAKTWARLYGGSIIVLGCNDGQTMDKPLAPERLKSIDYIYVLDRWDVQVHTRYGDPTQPKYGDPAQYRVTTGAITMPQGQTGVSLEAIIHESRCLRFDGALTGRRRKAYNFNGWSQSVIDTCYPIVRDFNQAFHGVSNILTDFSQAVIRIQNLAQMLAADQDGLVIKRLTMMDMSRSVARAVLLDVNESFDRSTISLAGIPDTIDRICQRLSAATGYPMTLLMGEAPAGLNATGDSDHRNFYNIVRNEQEDGFRPNLTYLLALLCITEQVTPSDEKQGTVTFHFKSLWQPTDSEQAETRLKVAQTDQIYIDRGVVDAAEIAVSRFGGERYSMETQLAKDEAPNKQAEDDPAADPTQADPKASASGTGASTSKGAAASGDVQATATNGAQQTSGLEILKAIADKSVTPEAAELFFELNYPLWPADKIKKMVASQLKAEVKEPPAPMPFPGQPPKAPPVPPKPAE